MNKGLESAIAIYGIMKAGGAYVPLDPFSPVGRINYIIQDCGIRHLITNEAQLNSLQQLLAEETRLECLIGIPPHTDLPIRCISWKDSQLYLQQRNRKSFD